MLARACGWPDLRNSVIRSADLGSLGELWAYSYTHDHCEYFHDPWPQTEVHSRREGERLPRQALPLLWTRDYDHARSTSHHGRSLQARPWRPECVAVVRRPFRPGRCLWARQRELDRRLLLEQHRVQVHQPCCVPGNNSVETTDNLNMNYLLVDVIQRPFVSDECSCDPSAYPQEFNKACEDYYGEYNATVVEALGKVRRGQRCL